MNISALIREIEQNKQQGTFLFYVSWHKNQGEKNQTKWLSDPKNRIITSQRKKKIFLMENR